MIQYHCGKTILALLHSSAIAIGFLTNAAVVQGGGNHSTVKDSTPADGRTDGERFSLKTYVRSET